MRLSKSMVLLLLVAHHHEHDHEHEQTEETFLLGRSWESQCFVCCIANATESALRSSDSPSRHAVGLCRC